MPIVIKNKNEKSCNREYNLLFMSADGSLGGYNGMREGEYVERKRALLEQERAISTHK